MASLELLDEALSEQVPPIPEEAAWHISMDG
jgi:hypothetical protein